MTPEQEQEYRDLAVELVNTFGEPLFEKFIGSLGSDARLLDTAANGIWLGMRKRIVKFPPQILAELKQLNGTRRIAKFLMIIAEPFVRTAPTESIEQFMNDLHPILDRINEVRKRGELKDGKAES